LSLFSFLSSLDAEITIELRMLFKTTFIVMVFFLLESILSNPVDLGEKDHEEFGRIVNGRPAKLGKSLES